jgi:hypothetical protein
MSKQHLTDARKGQGTVQKTGQWADSDPGGRVKTDTAANFPPEIPRGVGDQQAYIKGYQSGVQGHPAKDCSPEQPDRWGCVTEEQRQRRLKFEGCVKSAIDKVLGEFGLEKQPGSELMACVSYGHPDWITLGCNIVASPKCAHPPELRNGWIAVGFGAVLPDLGKWVIVGGKNILLQLAQRLYGVPGFITREGKNLCITEVEYWHPLPGPFGEDQCASGS